jgi:twitching motility protein PilU
MDYKQADNLLKAAIDQRASDIYLTYSCPPCLRINDEITPLGEALLGDEDLNAIIKQLVSADKYEEFDSTFEMNTAINWHDRARFRINAFKQQQHSAVVIRRIQTEIPKLEALKLPKTYGELVMQKRGLVLVVGPTGSGKSTSLAAMIGHRNTYGRGHIITVEDPIEYVHSHQSCIISQRDVGIDTYSYSLALKNALRQSPDVLLIGEIRDRDTMEHAINFSETGHLVLATLHARNASQAIERIINFFPEEKHHQLLLNLSLNLLGVLSQRLVQCIKGGRAVATEVMLNQGVIHNLIEEGKPKEIKEIMEKNRGLGMHSFEQTLLDMYRAGQISEEVALREADNPSNLKLQIRNVKLDPNSQTATQSDAPVHHFTLDD